MKKPNDIYNILNTIKSLESKDQAAPSQPSMLKTLSESSTPLAKTIRALNEKYMGFEKTVKAIEKGGSAKDPEAVAAAIGRKKYGKEKFQKAAAAGKKLGEGKPDYIDLDKDGDKEEDMKDAAKDAKKKNMVKENQDQEGPADLMAAVDEEYKQPGRHIDNLQDVMNATFDSDNSPEFERARAIINQYLEFVTNTDVDHYDPEDEDEPMIRRMRHGNLARHIREYDLGDYLVAAEDELRKVIGRSSVAEDQDQDQEGIEDLMAAVDEEYNQPGRHIDNLQDVMNATFDADSSPEFERARAIINQYLEYVTNTDVDHHPTDDPDHDPEEDEPMIRRMRHGNLARHIREYDLGDYLVAASDELRKALNNRPVAEEYKEVVPTTHEDPLVTVYDKDGIHTHANLSVVNRIFNVNVDAEDVHAGPVVLRSGWEDRRKIKIELSPHHDERMKKDMDEELLVPEKPWVKDPMDPDSKIPAYRRKEKSAGDEIARRTVDRLNKDAGADVWHSSRVNEAGLDMNLFKGAQGAMAGANIDPESERNREKPYGYRSDAAIDSDDDYDEWGNPKKKRMTAPSDGPKKKGRPRKNFGPERTTAKAYKHKGSRINLETFVEDAMAELDSLVVMEKLTAKDPAGEWISDFVHSDDPKFKGKSKEERKKQALGAYYAAKRDAKKVQESHDLNELARLAGLLENEDEEAKCNHTEEGEECPVHGLKECGSMMEGVMSEVDMELQNIAASGDEEELIDALGGLKGSALQMVLQDMMDEVADELAAKGMTDVINDEDKMIEMLFDKIVDNYSGDDLESMDDGDVLDMKEADMEEGNEFSGALAQARASGAEEFEVDGKTYKVNEDLQADDGEHYRSADDFFSQFEADHFDREEESDDGMEVRGYIDGVNVMAWRFDDESKTSGYGVYNDDALRELDETSHFIKGIKRFIKGKDSPSDVRDKHLGKMAAAPYDVNVQDKEGKRFDKVQSVIDKAEGYEKEVNECGIGPDMPEEKSGMSINSSLDTRTGNKTLSVTAQGDAAEQLARILKMAGLAGGEPQGMDRPMEEFINAPDEKIAPIDAAIPSGDDLHKKKTQHADKPKLGDNPLATKGANEIAEQLKRMYSKFGR